MSARSIDALDRWHALLEAVRLQQEKRRESEWLEKRQAWLRYLRERDRRLGR